MSFEPLIDFAGSGVELLRVSGDPRRRACGTGASGRKRKVASSEWTGGENSQWHESRPGPGTSSVRGAACASVLVKDQSCKRLRKRYRSRPKALPVRLREALPGKRPACRRSGAPNELPNPYPPACWGQLPNGKHCDRTAVIAIGF